MIFCFLWDTGKKNVKNFGNQLVLVIIDLKLENISENIFFDVPQKKVNDDRIFIFMLNLFWLLFSESMLTF